MSPARGAIEAFLGESGQNAALMTPAMTELLGEVFGFDVRWLVSTARDGTLRGAMPCFLLDSLLFGRRVATAPFNFFGAGAARGIEALSDLLEQVRSLAAGRRWVEIKATEELPEEAVARYGLAERRGFLTYEVPLFDEDDLQRRRRRRFREKLRSLQRRLGGRVAVAPADGLRDVARFHRLLTREYLRKHRTLPLPSALFERVWEALSPAGEVELLLLELDCRLAAGAFLFHRGPRSVYQWGAYELDLAAVSPLALLLDEAMRRAVAAGKSTFDLGLTAESHEGLRLSKSRWGAIERPLTWYYMLSTGQRVPDVSYDRSFATARALLPALPVAMARALPPRLIRQLA